MGAAQMTFIRSRAQVYLTDVTENDQHLVLGGAASASCSLQLNSSGTFRVENLRDADLELSNWLKTGLNSAYAARVTVLTGALTSGSGAGSWLVLSSNRAWTVSANAPSPGAASAAVSFTLEIRRVSDSVVIASCTVSLSADAEFA